MRTRVVAVTASTELIRDAMRVRLNEAYVRALEGAGLVPLVVPPLRDASEAEAIVERVGGLVLTGGEDVDPSCYGAAPHPRLGGTHPERDRWELALARAAHARRTPTLAICRGIQLLNVALGGTLVQDIPSERPSGLPHDAPTSRSARVHEVSVDAGSALAAALGATRLSSNSFHHQSLDSLGGGLRVTARAPDGIVEGAEYEEPGEWWAIGVQWHPEELVGTPEPWDRNLFEAFARRVTA